MAIKNSEIDWGKVDKHKSGNITHDKTEIKYQILKFTDDKRVYYQRVILEPFYAKSAWTITDPEVERSIKDFFDSKIKSKYNDIRLRDYKNNNYFKELNKIISGVDKPLKINKEVINELYHSENTKEFKNSKRIGNIWKEFEASNKVKLNKPPEDQEDPDIIKEESHKEMITKAQCHYCGITIKQINKLAKAGKLYTKRNRGYTMEIDQVDPFGGYTEGNCVPCCYWCNNAKTDEFMHFEFKEIARGINCVWNKRFKDAEIDEDVPFDEDSEVWGTVDEQKENKCHKQ